MHIHSCAAIAIGLFAGCVLATGTTATEPDLSGTWTQNSEQGVKWIIAQNGDNIHIQEMNGSRTDADYSCTLDGKECSLHDSGHAEKTSLYFNGPKLIELRTRENDVIKRRFTLSDDGKQLEVEVVPISPPGKTDVLTFQRQQ